MKQFYCIALNIQKATVEPIIIMNSKEGDKFRESPFCHAHYIATVRIWFPFCGGRQL